jgi:methylamine dehydrogenase heavy chain
MLRVAAQAPVFGALRFVWRLLLGLLLVGLADSVDAQIEPEQASVATLAPHQGQPWFWLWGNRAPSMVDGRAFLFDDNGKMLGQLDTGLWFSSLLPAAKRNELFAVETYFSRGTRGTRSDVITVYDPQTLTAKREISIPAKRMNALGNTGLAVLSDDERFLLVLNYTPAQSVSIVDLDSNRFVSEVETPGCASLYSGGPRDFYAICGDGGFLHVRLGEQGQVLEQQRSAPLFDPLQDLLTTAASRIGDTWYFVSRENNVYAIQMNAAGIHLTQQWSLLSAAERKDNWRISGVNHTAAHVASGRLLVLMHQGKPETFQEPGTEVWVYDVATQQRLERISLKEQSIAIGVSQDATPRLYSVDFVVPLPYLFTAWIYLTQGQDGIMKIVQQAVNIYDVHSGEHLHSVAGLPYGYLNRVLPW